jgi:hypothetical protein
LAVHDVMGVVKQSKDFFKIPDASLCEWAWGWPWSCRN